VVFSAFLSAVRQQPGCKCNKSDDHQKSGHVFLSAIFLRSLYKLIRGRLEKRIARIVSSKKAVEAYSHLTESTWRAK
jgi:hypothetical protein